MMPNRVQMSRQRPWRAEHPDAVICDRTTDLGNPYLIERVECEDGQRGKCWQVRRRDARAFQHFDTKRDAAACAVEQFGFYVENSIMPDALSIRAAIPGLRGRDLACWCGPDDPCHVDAILAFANPAPLPAPTQEGN